MAADYDAPRFNDQEEPADIIPAPRRADLVELDEVDNVIDISVDDPLSEAVIVPLQVSEFVCSECFLVVSRVRLDHGDGRFAVCEDCAA